MSDRFSLWLAFASSVLALTGLATGIAFPILGWTVLLLVLLGALAWVDAATHTVPDALTLALVICGLAYTFTSGLPIKAPLLIACTLIVAGILHARATRDEGWIGSGDFFLMAGVVAWFGPVLVIDILAITSFLLLLHGVIARRATIALAPSLAISATLIWLGGPLL